MILFGKRIEMMVDRYLISKTNNVSFRKTEPINHGRVIGFDEPWEGLGSCTLTMVDDGDNVKCYYRGFPTGGLDDDERQTCCLSISDDGLYFKRYPVNLYDYNGITENNIVYMGFECHNFAPFYDTNPECKPDERYKAVGGIIQRGGLYAFSSPDGIHWKKMSEAPVISQGHLDTINMAFWDSDKKVYRCYVRWNNKEVTSPEFPYMCRTISSCTSTDFYNWTDIVPNEYEDGLIDQLYTNSTRPVPGAEHILISMPMRFQQVRKKVAYFDGNAYGSEGVSDTVFMTSRDGVHWDRTLKDAWLNGGLGDKEWTQRSFETAGGIIVRGDDFYIYVEQHYMWDDDGIWAYSIPKYRFMSLYADREGGSVVTKRLKFEADDIYLNYSTSSYGYVKIAILDENGNVIYKSDEIYGNELSHKLHIDNLSGRLGTMVIELKEAHLYAIGSNME